MYDMRKVFLECVGEMRKVGIPVENGRVYERKAGNVEGYLGLCNDDGYYNFSIVIREDLLKETCPLKELKEVIIHELFHASPRILRHGEKWKKYAQMMNDAYGYSLLEGKDDDSIFHREKLITQRFVCKDCGSTFESRRKDKHDCKCVCCNKWMDRVG